ncbi:hypothetical protein NDU88_003838 [Pleurodeles waltl]|uniref:Uncharacterized protein n=1 Tax=Pleurodeles waltl TaxID=8319 RepID=A0AAV7TPQ2_PLEWA|nr:hypothetical protein NDU88_003838 [Pleurodeles waltl]
MFCVWSDLRAVCGAQDSPWPAGGESPSSPSIDGVQATPLREVARGEGRRTPGRRRRSGQPPASGRGAGAPAPPVAVTPDSWHLGNPAPAGHKGRGATPPQGKPWRRRYCWSGSPGRVTIPAPPMRHRRWWSTTPVRASPGSSQGTRGILRCARRERAGFRAERDRGQPGAHRAPR